MIKKEYLDHRGVMIDFILERRIRIFAEIGVDRGAMVKRVLRAVGGEMHEYWAIDRFAWPSWRAYKNADPAGQELRYEIVCRMMTYFPILHVVRMDAAKSAKLFRDGYFDAVFLDAGHVYQTTAKEIDAWLPKIKKGGVFAGHDYGFEHSKGVTRAVNEKFPNAKVLPWWVFYQEV